MDRVADTDLIRGITDDRRRMNLRTLVEKTPDVGFAAQRLMELEVKA